MFHGDSAEEMRSVNWHNPAPNPEASVRNRRLTTQWDMLKNGVVGLDYLAEMEFHQAIPQRLLTASHLSGKAEEMPSTGQDDALSAQRLQDWTRDAAFKCNDQVLKVCNYDILTEASTVAARFIMLP